MNQAAGAIGSEWQQLAALDRTNQGKMVAYENLAPQMGLDPGYLEEVRGLKDPRKQAAALAPLDEVFGAALQRQMQPEQFMPSLVDLGNGLQAVTTSRGGAQLIPQGGGERVVPPKVHQLEDGTLATIDPMSGVARPVVGEDGRPVKGRKPSAGGLLAGLFGEDGGTGAEPAPVGGAAAAPAAAAAVSRPAMGGYQVGRRYGGRTYLGGDPTQPTSWK